MRVKPYNNRNCLDLVGNNREVTPFQLLIVSTSGHGKGTSSEAIAERWKKTTNGVVIILSDPKSEGEWTFVMYEPTEKYHLQSLRRDGIKKNKYPAKLYHPYTHNLQKGYLPEIDFYTLSIKGLTQEDWSVLAESDSESETIKLIQRVANDLERNGSIFDFLHQIEKLTEGKKDKRRPMPDPKNWLLRSGGGTAKSVKEVGNLLSPFRRDYFLRKDTCEYKLNWETLLSDSENYHVFLNNWVESPKLKNFLVEVLLGQVVREAQHLSLLGKLKKPILLIVPELVNLCPSEDKGSSFYLAKALRKSLVSMRSKAKGISFLSDTQIWSQTSPNVRSSFNETFYGKLNPEDSRIILKANSYTQTTRDLFSDIEDNPGSFIWYKRESEGVFSIFMPSHMHKEVKYNWVSMYKKHYRDKMKRYDDLINKMKREFQEEEERTKLEVQKREKKYIEEEIKKSIKKESTEKDEEDNIKIPEEKKIKSYLYKRSWELHNEGLSDNKVGFEIGVSHKTAKKYYKKYEESLEENKEEIDIPIGESNPSY